MNECSFVSSCHPYMQAYSVQVLPRLGEVPAVNYVWSLDVGRSVCPDRDDSSLRICGRVMWDYGDRGARKRKVQRKRGYTCE